MRITFDTADVASVPALAFGVLHMDVPDEDVMSRIEALQILGFRPEVSL